jgi:hypothetical protein
MQITFQSGFEGDETDAVVNERLDRLVALANRQKAIAEVPKLEDDVLKQRETLSQLHEDLERIEAGHVAQQKARRDQLDAQKASRARERKKHEASIDVMILEMQDVKQRMFNEGADEARSRGRMGAYKPQGVAKTNLDKVDHQIALAMDGREKEMEAWDVQFDEQLATAQAEIEKAESERDQAIAQIGVSIKRYEDAIAVSTEKLNKARAAAGG